MDWIEVLPLFTFQQQIVEQFAFSLDTFIYVMFLLKSLSDDVYKFFDRREFFTSNWRYLSTDFWRNFACLDDDSRLNRTRVFNGFSCNMKHVQWTHWTSRLHTVAPFFFCLLMNNRTGRKLLILEKSRWWNIGETKPTILPALNFRGHQVRRNHSLSVSRHLI